jgi:LysM repeat protein
MKLMYLRGRLQWSLLVISVVSGVIAVLLSRGGGEPEIVVPTTVETTIPASTTTVYVEPVYYTVEPGDSLFAISKKFNLNMAELMKINNITNPDKVNAGDVIQLPVATGFVPVAPSTTMKP